MATTIAHPRSVRSGPSGKTIAGFLVGVLAAFAVGYGINGAVDTVDASPSSALGADQVHIQRAADFAAQQSMSRGADLVILQKAADYAALQARVAEGERMLAINELPSVPSMSSAADFGSFGASHALPDYIKAQIAERVQNARWESTVEYLTEQWTTQQSQLEPKTPGPVE